MDPRAKEQHVHSVFERIAPKYDRMNDLISFGRHKSWRKFTMRKMAMKPGDTAIDLCCGTCDWTIDLARTSGKGGIVGLDFSQAMLDVGKSKVDELGLSAQISLVQGNAMALPFPDDHFDYATIGFGLRNVPDLVTVLSEMRRVVKPGGKVVCLEMSKPSRQPFKGVYYFYFRQIMPLIGKLVAKRHEEYKWLPESLVSFPDMERLAEIYREVGLENVQAYPFVGGVAALHIGTKGSDKQ
ncbi:bifunctional demethylmenaquinone methyltransferase/2-methoxy-6-polyprenyl-1,4-benzoquinol methylase [Paenibacillus sp. 598K]|uniref:demethylmenaquinone methyltransferase n=1 Tax=Paenibacillus sp. 598K TaxID=1117987 RepID=UPI000FFA0CB0|nr:demethylmenaquinone methyltransferase [Paenibacillus sp. 598K]GBF72765.1 bifunctional demethylmenaquinone methyltransferase/2-methoxy-6-polyprenyl-1,4-benzoquinol methylase [Paenibacillus sp. 598K]